MTKKQTDRQIVFQFLPVAVVLTVIIAGSLSPLVAQTPTKDKEEAEEEQIESRREWFFSTRRAGTESDKDLARLRHAGVLATHSSLEAQRLRRSIGVDSAQHSWISMGPSPSTFGGWAFGNVSGRVASIAADWAGGALYAGTASGGLWKSTDDGISWTSILDSAGTQTVGTVAVDPTDPNVIWVGTGENSSSCESYFGIGLLRSADGGLTWEARNGTGGNTLDDLASFANVIVDPRDSNRIVTGGNFRGCSDGSQQNGGLYTSNDGGLSWVPRLVSTAIYGIARDPAVLDILWAATGQGVSKSVDNGITWTLQTNSGLPHNGTGPNQLAIAPSDGNTVYALFAGGPSLWRTINGGVTWTQMASGSSACEGQCWYNMVLRVHPTNPDIVYRGTMHIFKSVNGGANWTDLSAAWGETQKVHQDTHDLLIDPHDPNTFYVGCDGGIWKTTDGGSSFINLNGNINATQFYAIDVQADDPGVICGGAQDNSSLARTTSDVWDLQRVTGDGFVCHIDPRDANRVYITSYGAGGYPQILRSTTGLFGGFSLITAGRGISPGDRFAWVTPYVLDPIRPNILYLGTHRVYRSADYGNSWTQVGPPDLTASGTLLSLEINPNFTNVLYSGSQEGKVWRTVNSGADWVDITNGLPPGHAINDIAGDPTNPDRAFAVVGGFNTPHLWAWTASAGWVARGSGLPNVPANAVLMLTDSDILVGTDTGIFRSRDGGVSIQPYMDGLPEGLVVTDLKYNRLQSVVTAGTYGRGAWQVSIDVDPLPPVVGYDSIELPLVEVHGDGDGVVERGETWSVRPILKNRGGASALGVQARLATSTAGVTILDGGPRPYGDIAPGATSAVASAYRFALDPSSCGSEITFDLLGISSTTPGVFPDTLTAFTIPSACPRLQYDSFSNLTEIEGNGNGGIDPGETWELTVKLRNRGDDAAAGITADLIPDPASAVSVTMLQATSTYADMAKGAAAPSATAYRFRVDSFAPCGESISLGIAARSTDPQKTYATEVGMVRLVVGGTGPAVTVFKDNFESPNGDWYVDPGDYSQWQIDIPRGLGSPVPDPNNGFDGPHVLGNDLTGLGLVPGNYETDSTNLFSTADSPLFDFSRYRQLSVSYARWLNVGAGDTATFYLYDAAGPEFYHPLYSSNAAADSSWTHVSYDISDIADGRDAVWFMFSIMSDPQGTASGWNVDDFELRGVPVESCEPYIPVRYAGHGGLTEVDGNGNGVVDPGETWELPVSLRNDGPVPAGGVSADLTVDPATPGSVFVLHDRASYGTINPGQVVSSLGAYRFRVGDNFPCGGRVVLSVSAITSTVPAASHPDEAGVIIIPVGNSMASVKVFSDGFEPRGAGPYWTAEGEWQDDKPRGLGGPLADPASAYEGQYVVGTDLTGLGPNPGNYENGVASSLYSPNIPVSGVVPSEIRFAHWINIAQGDYATMRVSSDVPGDVKTFQWPAHSASSWTFDTFDISDMAANKSWLRVQFLLQSDAQGTSSGWNMDKFEIWAPTCQAFQRALPGEASNLRVSKGASGQLTLRWGADCGAAATYGVYRGDLRVGYSSIAAEPGACDVTGTSAAIPQGSGVAEFFLVVPHKDGEDGSYGTKSSGVARPAAVGGCYPQGAFAVCAP